MSAVTFKVFGQTLDYITQQPTLVPAGKTKRTWRWTLFGVHIWRITAGNEVPYVQTTPAGVVRLDETEALMLLQDEFARSLGYPTFQAWNDANAAYVLAREVANRETRDEALRKATEYVTDLKLPTLVGSGAEVTLGQITREGLVRIGKAAVLFDATTLKVAKRASKIQAAKTALRALERCTNAAWLVANRHALGKPSAAIKLDRVLTKLAALDVPAR